MLYQAACQAQAFQYQIVIFALLMDNFVMSLKPQVMTLIKHHVNQRLNVRLRTSRPGGNRLDGEGRQLHVNAIFVKPIEINFYGFIELCDYNSNY